jgi:hypothetical protein
LKEGGEDVIIVLNGSLPSLESGRIKLRVLLDRMVNHIMFTLLIVQQGRVCEVLEGIKHQTHPLLAGRRRYDLEENIEKAFNVAIYMHAPTVKVFKDDPHIDRHYDRIYVTGAQSDVQKAVAALQSRVILQMSFHSNVIDGDIYDHVERCCTAWEQD